MNYGINLGQWNSIFAVPTDVVDKHMKLAGAAQLKVLLYLLRHSGEAITLEKLAFAIGQKPADTQDAVEYWINCGVLSKEDDIGFFPSPAEKTGQIDNIQKTLCENTFIEQPAQPTITPTLEVKNAVGEVTQVKTRDKIRYQFDECMKFVAENSELKNMLTTVEASLGKQLNHTEVACFVTLAKWYGLPCSVIPMLVHYCTSIGKNSINYIESTGIGWAAEEVDTIEKADKKIAGLESHRKAWNMVRYALEIPERKPTDRELAYCDLWINQQHFDIDVIRLAYDKCIDKNGKSSFGYINGILKKYFEKGINDLTSALKSDEQFRSEQDAKFTAKKMSENAAKDSNGRYAATFDSNDIEAILDAEWMAESVGSDSDYDYDD